MTHNLTMTPAAGDQMLDRVLSTSRNMAVPYFLFASYLYYHRDFSLLTDERYDRLCKELLEEWGTITHRHKDVIDKDALSAGSGFSISEGAYPPIVVGAACHLAGIDAPRHKPRPQYTNDGDKVSQSVAVPPPKKKIMFTIKRKVPDGV